MLSGVRMKPVDEVLASPIVQQTAFWSEVKKNLGVGTGAYAFKLPKSDVAGCSGQSGSQEADVLVVQQQLDAHHSIAYVPYGPEIEPVGRTAAGGYVSGGEWQQGDVFVWGICYRKQSADGQLCPAVGCRAEGKTHGLYRIRYVWCGAECRSGASHVWFISF